MQFKNSKQRNTIVAYMSKLDGHVSAEQLHEALNKESSISLATVYRNLAILEELKQIKKIALPEGGYVYDKTFEPHYHFYCDECHSLYDLESPYLSSYVESFHSDSNIASITTHELTIHGICKNCNH